MLGEHRLSELEAKNNELKQHVEQLEKALRKVAELGLFVQTQTVNERRLEVTALLRKVAAGDFGEIGIESGSVLLTRTEARDAQEEGKPRDIIDDTETTTNRT